MLVIVYERNRIADILFEADLSVLCVFTEGSFVFANKRFMLVVAALRWAPNKLEFKVAA